MHISTHGATIWHVSADYKILIVLCTCMRFLNGLGAVLPGLRLAAPLPLSTSRGADKMPGRATAKRGAGTFWDRNQSPMCNFLGQQQ